MNFVAGERADWIGGNPGQRDGRPVISDGSDSTARRRAAKKNPKGISSFSPGLVRAGLARSYPGLTTEEVKTPTGFRQPGQAEGCNPVGVDDCFWDEDPG